jgi:hypothetical protein
MTSNPTELVIIGTMHKHHNTAEYYTTDALGEIFTALQPAALCVALNSTFFGPDGYLKPELRQPQDYPEIVVADDIAKTLGIREIPFDQDDRNEYYNDTRYFECQENATSAVSQFISNLQTANPLCQELKLVQLLEHAKQLQFHLGQCASPRLINSEVYDSIVRMKRLCEDALLALLEQHDGMQTVVADLQFVAKEWSERNHIMADNLRWIAADYAGKCLVVMVGAEHRYILWDLLLGQPGIELREFWQVS